MKYLFLLMIIACTSNTEVQSKMLIVADHLENCVGVGPQSCMLVKENPEDEWTYFYESRSRALNTKKVLPMSCW